MRWVLLISLIALGLCACADDAPRPGAAAAGTYRLDKDAMRAPWLEAYDELIDRRVAGLPTEGLRAREKPKGEAAKAKFRRQFETLDVTLGLTANGTWSLRGTSLGGPLDRRGSWSLVADQLTLVEAGAPRPKDATTSATYRDGVVRMRPEPHMPVDMVFQRE